MKTETPKIPKSVQETNKNPFLNKHATASLSLLPSAKSFLQGLALPMMVASTIVRGSNSLNGLRCQSIVTTSGSLGMIGELLNISTSFS